MSLSKRDYRVVSVPHKVAAPFIREHHYAKGCSNTAKVCFALYRLSDGAIVGAAMWMLPPAGGVKKYGFGVRNMLSLSRLAVHPDVPCNGASFLVGACIRRIARDMPEIMALITFADEMQGHEGAIYRATNWRYEGQTAASYRWVDQDGKLVSKYSTKTQRVATLDAKYRRVGPFKKHRFTLFRKGSKFTSQCS